MSAWACPRGCCVLSTLDDGLNLMSSASKSSRFPTEANGWIAPLWNQTLQPGFLQMQFVRRQKDNVSKASAESVS